jgi:DNA segregation ATPase FtsK/SpoIIIE-like protein
MVMQDYPRQGVDPVGLHTLMARPALRDSEETVFDSSSVVAAVTRLAGRWRPAPPVRRLPDRVELGQIRSMAAERSRPGTVWALDEFGEPVSLDGRESPFLVITGRARSGRTTAAATLMSEIARVYAPGSSRAPASAADLRPPAQVWLVTPNRQLLKVLPESYVERFAYRADDVKALAMELSAVLAQRLPEKGLSMAESLTQRWSGPEIFLIVDDSEKLPPGLDAPLHPLAGAVNAAEDVGLRVIYTRRFGGWAGSQRADPLLAGMLTANAPLLVMDSDPDEGFVRGRWKGHDMAAGRGFLMITAESGRYVQVGWVPVDRASP